MNESINQVYLEWITNCYKCVSVQFLHDKIGAMLYETSGEHVLEIIPLSINQSMTESSVSRTAHPPLRGFKLEFKLMNFFFA